jgi:hypothetical protein
MHRSSAVLIVLVVAACSSNGRAPIQPRATESVASPSAVVPVYADTQALRLGAQAVVDAFAAQVAEVRGGAFAAVPQVEVRNTPQLIMFQRDANRIVVPEWETTPEAMRSVFAQFANGGAAEAEHLFRAIFNRFLVAHEAAHWFQAHADRREATLYANENAANQLAVAFWRTQPDGERLLAELERLTSAAADALPDPTPAGVDAVAYFGANYQTLGADPLKYGYYQFRFMRDAIRERDELDFAAMTR